jgi:hypothetical protein
LLKTIPMAVLYGLFLFMGDLPPLIGASGLRES